MTIHKKTIPHPHDAGNDAAKHVKYARHALDQIEAGHYAIENPSQEDLGNGRVRITFERVETNPSHKAEPHGLG